MVINKLHPHLFILLNHLLLGQGDDSLQFMEASLHFSQTQPSVVLLFADSLQLLLTMFFCYAGTLLPLLDTLREDLIDPATNLHKYITDYISGWPIKFAFD